MSRPSPLEHEAVDAALAGTDWQIEDGELALQVEHASFAGALGFVVSVGALAEAADHHPDIDLRYRTVFLRLATHDVGALTQLDVELARAIDGLLGSTLAT